VIPLVLYDDARARAFEPFASTRPLSEMLAGSALIRERWERALGVECIGHLSRPELDDFEEEGAPGAVSGDRSREWIIASSRFVPRIAPPPAGGARNGIARWVAGGVVVAVRVTDGLDLESLREGDADLSTLDAIGGETVELGGWNLEWVWDLVRILPEVLESDLGPRPSSSDGERRGASLPEGVHVIGGGELRIAEGATVDPLVVLDTSAGGIVIEEGAVIHSYTRLNGPCYVGRKSTVLGGDVSGCAIGPVCKVRGEISVTTMLGYSNKGHDGFVGHSYLGRWVNLGAGTITSNLKNTYSPVEMWTPDGEQTTGLQFLGTMFGDHAKTGIGLSLTTGTVVGTGANVFEKMPPKAVPPFSWGSGAPYSTYRLDKFLEVTERVMKRRSVELTERSRRLLSSAHAGRWTVEGAVEG
jgi:UDP-N-acetylglucosamine diphosphorylase / glucose-1-phosphate thymidylyltransferase / UDP-N-acetylgalactosamine diphosphorylase / glucosamine-1-phosphate N-acetyltransferase / galactosamine-1-phosphate N-acetyltransferase